MERSAPARKPHSSTADLLSWRETPLPDPPSAVRQHMPSDGVKKVVFGGQIKEEEVESELKMKPCSDLKLKEMTGSGIFVAETEDGQSESMSSFYTPKSLTGSEIYRQAHKGISQISFSTDETVSLRKPTSVAEVAKQRELSGTLQSESEAKLKKQLSDAKCKELSGHDIFSPPEVPPKSLRATNFVTNDSDCGDNLRNSQLPSQISKVEGGPSNFLFGEEAVAKTKKIYTQKAAELTGIDIFKGDAPPGSAEKPLSAAKMKEISGSDIFAAGKAPPSRDYFGGVRKPPGGESSIALI